MQPGSKCNSQPHSPRKQKEFVEVITEPVYSTEKRKPNFITKHEVFKDVRKSLPMPQIKEHQRHRFGNRLFSVSSVGKKFNTQDIMDRFNKTKISLGSTIKKESRNMSGS
jgi:hypothetical protein